MVPVWAAAADALIHRETEVSVLLFVGVFVCQCPGVCRRFFPVSAVLFVGVLVWQCLAVCWCVRVSVLCCSLVCLWISALVFVSVFVCHCQCHGLSDRRTENLRITENTEMMMKPQLQQSEDSWHFYFTLGYFVVSIIHRTLTWTTGSLTCVCDFFARLYTRGPSVYSLTRKIVVESAQNLSPDKCQGGRTA